MRPRQFLALISGIAIAVPVALLSVPSPANAAAAAAPAAAAAAPAPDRMPGDVPSRRSAWVNDGEVTKIVQVGNTMIAGGLFTSVSDPMNGPTYARQNLVAFDATTGLVSQTFNPTVDGQVQQLLPGPTADTVYVAGDFTKINGKGPNHLQLININTGQAVTSFKAPSTGGGIETMELLPNNRLFIGGFFKKIGGLDWGQMATLNATTGALDQTYMNLATAGNHNTGTGAKAPIGPREAGLTPDGTRMVVVGNFRTVGGLARDQIVMINLGATQATVATDWYTTGYTPICSPNAFDSYMRDVEMSPDGSFFVVATTGGPHAGTLCDTAARFETNAVGTSLTPTWTDTSGGDTLWGVEVTQSAVYVGGHNRWMNNPNGSDRAAQGALPRPGLSALDPQTGVPLKWNPGRNPRGEAAYEIFETNDGVWITSDTNYIGDNKYERHRIAFFPYNEGSNTASKKVGSLPGNVYVGAPLSATNVLYRVNAGGAAIASTDNGPDWLSDNAATSPYHNTGATTSSYSALTAANLVNVPASTPLGIWTNDRNDPTGGNEMQWAFPVTTGTSAEVRLYFASRSSSTRTFNVSIDGVNKLSNYNPNSDPGVNKGTMKSFDITSDGNVNIDFGRITGNPEINAIEILNKSVGPNSNSANVVNYDGTNIAAQGVVATDTFDWTNVRGAVMVGRTLFYGMTDNMLYKRSFDGVSFGPAEAVNPYIDPAWNTVLTGSGPADQTYTGVLPTWYSQLNGVTGMFYSNGKLYYTRSGQNTLYWRWFSPDSGAVNPTENTVTGGNITWSATKGMFLDGNTLYVVNSTNGQLLKIGWTGTAPTGTSTVANSTIDWRGKALFLASVLPNVPPTASFTSDCEGVVCDFDATGSSDTDGSVQSYEWTFSDGEQAGGPTPQKEFPATGTYDVTLTVTDDGGLTSSTTQQVSVEKPNVAPTAAFAEPDCEYLVCSFTSTSTDSDGTIDDYSWDFGDGDTGTGATADHEYDAPGVYTVTLTVTDDDDATDDATRTFSVVAAPEASTVSYRGGAVTQGNLVGPNVFTPTTVQAGDRLILALTINNSTGTMSAPTGVTGWTVLDTATSGSMQTRVYTKIATATDANKRVTVTLNVAAKYTMNVAAYSGVRSGALVYADFAENVSRAGHPTPTVDAPAGSWVVSYWADKSATTTGFTTPGSVTERAEICGTNSGHICSTLADSNGSVPAGQYGNVIGTADSANATATTWSIILRTQEANQAPTSSFTYTCESAACNFTSTSSDPDGSVASYAWDFGDGGTATGANPSHDFVTTGTRNVTLTVTDDENTTGSSVQEVSVVRTNAKPTASFTANCDYLSCTVDATGSSDSDGTVDSYSWDFGDGDTDTGMTPAAHPYDVAGPYTITLTVTDNDGGTGTTTRNISPVAVRPIAFVNGSSTQANTNLPATTIPANVNAGDRLFMVLSRNTVGTQSTPTGVTGWTIADTETVGTSMATVVYTKVAVAADAGKTVRVPLDVAAKHTLTVAAYRGDMLAPEVTGAVETVNRVNHKAPNTTVADGDVILSYFADKTAATTGFTLPNDVTGRQPICNTGSGHVCSTLAESAPLAAGPYTGITATADASSANATMFTIRLRQDS